MSYVSNRLAALLRDAERDDAAVHICGSRVKYAVHSLSRLYAKVSDNATKRSILWNKSVDHMAHRSYAQVVVSCRALLHLR
jgi:hypothetical protein